jgi:hypothetical protein
VIALPRNASALTREVLVPAALQLVPKVSVKSDLAASDNASSSAGGPEGFRRVNHQRIPKLAERFTEQGPHDGLSAVSGPTLGLHGFRLTPGSPA